MNTNTETTVTKSTDTSTTTSVHMGFETIWTEVGDTETVTVRWFAGDVNDDGQGVRNYFDTEAEAEAAYAQEVTDAAEDIADAE